MHDSTTPATALDTTARRITLDRGWSLDAASTTPIAVTGVAASVPGSVHTDLMTAGLIPDPYLDDNERLLAWIGLADWRYSTTFDWSDGGADRVDLVFDGLDTVAAIELNGTAIGGTRNMHRSYRFDVSSIVRDGSNDLVVTFSSAIKAADTASLELGYRPHVNHHPYNALRKMACSFGWDWGIDTSTAGIWKPVRLEAWSTARLAGVQVAAKPLGDPTAAAKRGEVSVSIDLERASDDEVSVTAAVAGATARILIPRGESTATLTIPLDAIERWWPIGYGEQPLYDVEVVLASGDTVLDSRTRRVGFRTVELDTTPDAAGTPFTLVVNETPVFVRGANWIPDDAFPHRVDRARLARRFEQARFANMNLIRVWGGGIYESDDFYELADEQGLLVWQDFLFACAAYAEEEPMRSEVEAEAREAVARLGDHASLVLLNGNNENLWGFDEWNWKLRLDGKTWGAGYYFELFPAIVRELAPLVAYTPGSPFSPDAEHAPNDPEHGTMHIWDLWNQRDYPEYRTYSPRFVAEFGWQAPPTWSTLTSSLSDDPLTPESPGMLVHQKAMEGNVKLTDGLLRHYPLPNELDAWHWAMQLNQANAITTAIEHFRSLQPHCMGSIVWQLNDCWPVTSWAAVDGYERPKPLLFALRAAYADRLVTFQPREGGLAVVLVNDSATEWRGSLAIERRGFDGSLIESNAEDVAVPPRGAVTHRLTPGIATPGDGSRELIRASLGESRGHWYFVEPRDSALAEPRFDATVEAADGGYHVVITASTLIRDMSVLVDRAHPDARVSTMLETLLPGESTTVTVSTSVPLEASAIIASIRTANELVSR